MSAAEPGSTGQVGSSHLRIACDVGSTFTDVAVARAVSGEIVVVKTPTTPRDPVVGVINGLTSALRSENLDAVAAILHGTTTATNAVITRALGRSDVALITTEGFANVLEMGKKDRSPQPYNLLYRRPAPLVGREHIYEVAERITAAGEVRKPLDLGSARAVLEHIVATQAPKVIAVCLLHSYVNAVHEEALRELITDVSPDMFVTISSDVDPAVREYERTVTTVLNAYVMPVVRDYITHLDTSVRARGFRGALYMAQANGGLSYPDELATRPLGCVQATHAGSLKLAASLGRQIDIPDAAVIDMGGTSLDVGFITQAEPQEDVETEIAGFPARLQVLQSRSIGAGGGSIAWVDDGGALRVGPKSAGADPGPACYQRGGTMPTVTDANLVLGRLSYEGLAVGAGPEALQAARKALEREVAEPLGLTVENAAAAVLAVVNAAMAEEIRMQALQNGLDFRDLALIAVGGAGPLHAVTLCTELGAKAVVIPKHPAHGSAMGYLLSDFRCDLIAVINQPLEAQTIGHLRTEKARLCKSGESRIGQIRSQVRAIDSLCRLDMRYSGQGYSISVPWDDQVALQPEDIRESFHQEHMRIYGYRTEDSPVEITNMRVSVIGRIAHLEPSTDDAPKSGAVRRHAGKRNVSLQGEAREVPVYSRDTIERSQTLTGPVIIEEVNTTTVVEPGYSVDVTSSGALLIKPIQGRDTV